MPFDPAADPWGAAMLGTAVLWVLSLLLVVFAFVAGTSRRLGGRLMLVAVLGFLGTTAAGTWERIARGEAGPDGLPPAPAVAEAATAGNAVGAGSGAEASEGSAGATETADDAASGDGGTTDTEGASTEGGPTNDDGSTEHASGGDAGEVTPPGLDPPAPLPTDPEAREAEIRTILRQAAKVADGRGCSSLDEVAGAWAELRRLATAEQSWPKKAESVTERLERCRRRLLYSISRRYRRAQIDEREAWFDGLVEKFEQEHGLSVAVSLSGKSHERLRIGGTGLDAAKADALMDGGLRTELQSLGFAHVVLSDGKVPRTYELDVTPEDELGLPDLRAVGLGDPLTLSR